MPDEREYLQTMDKPALTNAIKLLKLQPNHEGFAPLSLRCLIPELRCLCAHAITAQVETVTQNGDCERNGFPELYRLVAAAPKPAVIVLLEIGGHSDYSAHDGEVMAEFFTRFGAVGLVSDCGDRDLPEFRRLLFRYVARGSGASQADFRIVRSRVPVQIRGMVVKLGDLLQGDENGLITVLRGFTLLPPDRVEEVRKWESAILPLLRSERFSLDDFNQAVVE